MRRGQIESAPAINLSAARRGAKREAKSSTGQCFFESELPRAKFIIRRMSNASQSLDPNAPVKTVHCQTPEEFLGELSKHRGPLPRQWIFRRHSDDAYQLIPSALRNNSQLLIEGSSYPEVRDSKTQRFLEVCMLDDFFKTADSIGLALPEDTQVLRNYLFRARHESDTWPQEHVLSLMALAQHHGVPTRLLDWSRNPLKAALFAASAATKNADKTGRLSVWAFSLALFELCIPIPLQRADRHPLRL